MPKQDKEGGINPTFDSALFLPFKTAQRGGQFCRPAAFSFFIAARLNKRETRIDLYPESWTFFKRDSVISGIELDS